MSANMYICTMQSICFHKNSLAIAKERHFGRQHMKMLALL
jgi:hypothetical protein